jgi:hypothetical protein
VGSKSDARTKQLEPERIGRGQPKRRLLLLATGAIALVAIIVVVALASGGGGSEDGNADGAKVAAKQKTSPAPKPKPLSRSTLIAKADAICAESQRAYVEIRDMESEMSSDVPYAEALVRLARNRIRDLRDLTPPKSLAKPYGEYVAAQEKVYATDKQALAAAKQEDAAGVEEARNLRDSEDALRERLAREIGFSVCSTPQS